jgi:Domain of unknown function (DUF4268)
VRDALAGGEPHRTVPALRRWFDGYSGVGRGAVNAVATPEPYVGPLGVDRGVPRLVVLGLNPGRADLGFQGPGGVFAHEYQQLGGFSAWAVTEPYLRDPWRGAKGRNPYHENLRALARRWLDDPSVPSRDVLAFELYPWHSDAATAAMAPDADLIDEFIWRPISEIDVSEVIAIGSAWQCVGEGLGLSEYRLDVSFTDQTRQARAFALRSGQRLVVTWHQGSNRPPNEADVGALRAAVRGEVRPISPPIDRRPARDRVGRRATGAVDGRDRPASNQAYPLFWTQLTDRLRHEHPSWRVGTPRGNDYPLFSPLPGSRVKCNFSRDGLRVELLLQSSDRSANVRRFHLLIRNLPGLQDAFGPNPILTPEPLEGRTQARLAAYRPGTIDEQHSWPAFLDWFLNTIIRLDYALNTVRAIEIEWPR